MNREVSQIATAGDDLDQLLGAYFRAEMPDPWPAAPTPPVRTLAKPVPRLAWHLPLTRSRLALAASVALLLGGLLLLGTTQQQPSGNSIPTLGPGDAMRPGPFSLPPLEEEKPAPPLQETNSESSLSLEQTRQGTGIKIIIKEVPADQ